MSEDFSTTVGLLRGADAALARTLESLREEEWHGPSLLPGWTRSHVVAHLALNAEGLARVLAGLRTGSQRTMYDSDSARANDIEELASQEPEQVASRVVSATRGLASVLQALDAGHLSWHFDRTPGGQVFPVSAVPLLRVREVEVHHVDLDAGYAPSSWSPEFRLLLIDSLAGRPQTSSFRVHAEDLDRSWDVGEPDGAAPTVRGDSADLAWWLTGRGAGDGLEVDGGALPAIAAW